MSWNKREVDSRSLHSILLSKRANIYYLEKCRVIVNGGRVEYISDAQRAREYYNIPIANTSVILLGTGTSISTAAMREISRAGVCVGFCGGGGTPLHAGSDIYFQSPQNEYRKTQYIQGWCSFWYDGARRLQAAKALQTARMDFTKRSWSLPVFERAFEASGLEASVNEYSGYINKAQTTNELLGYEGAFTSRLYALASRATSIKSFTRAKNGSGIDAVNRSLDSGNYLAYGLAASALWVLGIPHGLPLMHGKTRPGGLVFDIADIVKDGIILPSAFFATRQGLSGTKFRNFVIANLVESCSLDEMIESVKNIIDKYQVITPSDNPGVDV